MPEYRFVPVSYPKPTTPEPEIDQLIQWEMDGSDYESTDGCKVEPDGTCEHGHPSWAIVMGVI